MPNFSPENSNEWASVPTPNDFERNYRETNIDPSSIPEKMSIFDRLAHSLEQEE